MKRRDGQRGAMGGVEVVPVASLVLITGVLLVADAWAVLDAKLAVEQAAREGARAGIEEPERSAAAASARRAATDAFSAGGRPASRLEVRTRGRWDERCAAIEVRTSTSVRSVRLPFIGPFGPPVTVRGRHREVLDPYRSGLRGEAGCG